MEFIPLLVMMFAMMTIISCHPVYESIKNLIKKIKKMSKVKTIAVVVVVFVVFLNFMYTAFSIAEKSWNYFSWSNSGGIGYAVVFGITSLVACLLCGHILLTDEE